MKPPFFIGIILAILLGGCAGEKKGSELQGPFEAIPLTSVTITDPFWGERISNNHRVSVINMFRMYEEQGTFPSPKLIEAAGHILLVDDDPELRALADSGIVKLLEYVLPGGQPRLWKQLLNGEMYFAGHTMEAAIPYYQATGDRTLLDAAILLADDIDANFGPGKRLDISQHEEIKIGLLKLYHFTGDEKYLNLAKFFLDERGHSHNDRELYGEYAQDHKPVLEQEEVVGHAVRATYLYTPLAELAAITGDPGYAEASDRLWEDAVYRKTYLTGHVGSYRDHEDFGEAYDLPNVSCWNETCASIGNFFWNHNMFALHREAKYADMMERLLYNAILPGVSLDGSQYFYQNPLRSFGGVERHEWFGPNCCPPNVARLMASLGSYIYAVDGDELYVNLFIGSSLETEFNGNPVVISQESGLPWESSVKISVESDSPSRFTMRIRIPGWTGDSPMPGGLYSYLNQQEECASITVDGKPVKIKLADGYAVINREWNSGDVVELSLPMNTRIVTSSPDVKENTGYVAVERGPLVYCAEGIDNGGSVTDLLIPASVRPEVTGNPGIPGEIVALKANVERVSRDMTTGGISLTEAEMIMVPYFAWAHRGSGEMSVWLAADNEVARIAPMPSIASGSRVISSCGEGSVVDNYPGGEVPSVAKRFYPSSQSGSVGFEALYDMVKPVDSFDGSSTYLSLRPQEGDEAWVQYSFDEPVTLGATEVYWKDDKQYCRVPLSWNIVCLVNGEWVQVETSDQYGVEKDKFNRVEFEPLEATAIRLEMKLRGLDFRKGELGPPDGNYMPENTAWYETGIIEWQVYDPS